MTVKLSDKVRGMVIGTAVGDSLGMPVETWSRDRILSQYPIGIVKYETPSGHKWFDNEEAGTVTDDTQLTRAVIIGLMTSLDLSLESIGKCHIAAMGYSTKGWGATTREAIRNIANGVSVHESGKLLLDNESARGVGNGVIMKVAPIAAWIKAHSGENYNYNQFLVDFSAMTHYTKMSAIATVVHTNVLIACMKAHEEYRLQEDFYDIIRKSIEADDYDVSHLADFNEEDDIKEVLLSLEHSNIEQMSFKEIAEKYKGTCYVYHSLPYIYAHWIKNHYTVNTMYDSINWGGDRNDSDTNASVLGAMLGALYGLTIFYEEQHLVKDLKCYQELITLTDYFCETLGVE